MNMNGRPLLGISIEKLSIRFKTFCGERCDEMKRRKGMKRRKRIMWRLFVFLKLNLRDNVLLSPSSLDLLRLRKSTGVIGISIWQDVDLISGRCLNSFCFKTFETKEMAN